jgi:hypothetical protein
LFKKSQLTAHEGTHNNHNNRKRSSSSNSSNSQKCSIENKKWKKRQPKSQSGDGQMMVEEASPAPSNFGTSLGSDIPPPHQQFPQHPQHPQLLLQPTTTPLGTLHESTTELSTVWHNQNVPTMD